LLVEPGDPEALRAGLRRLLDADDLRSRLIDAGEQRAAEFSLARLAERYVPVYETAVAVEPS
jgi:glycosyltransferase involved in cell wall biosynthesis